MTGKVTASKLVKLSADEMAPKKLVDWKVIHRTLRVVELWILWGGHSGFMVSLICRPGSLRLA